MSREFTNAVKAIKLNSEQLFSPRVTEWLMHNSEVEMTPEMIELVIDILADESNSIRHTRFGSSSRGGCQRQQLFTYLGMPGKSKLDYRLNSIFLDGHWRHLRWQLVGLAAGALTHVEVPFAVDKYNLTGSVDGLNEDEGWIFELKGAFQLPSEVPFKHLLQIHTYFLGTGYDRCAYVVECKRTQEFREWVVHKDDEIMKQVRKELDDLNRALDEGQLPQTLAECDIREGAYKTCPYAKECLKQASWPEESKWG